MSIEDIVIGILAEDHDIIPYRKSLRKLAGSVTATILLQQMIWRGKHHGWEPFYKFKAPCNHELYTHGDSWTEEMGFSEEEFDAAIKRIGTKITRGTSKSDALADDKPTSIVVYWTDASRVTWYQVNKDLLGKLLLTVYLVSGESPDTLKTVKPDLPLVTETPTETTTKKEQKLVADKQQPARPSPDNPKWEPAKELQQRNFTRVNDPRQPIQACPVREIPPPPPVATAPPAPKKREKTPPHPNTSPILAAFTEAKEAAEPGCTIYYEAEGVAAKRLAEKGWTPEQVVDCFNVLKSDVWWKDKSLHLATIANQIGAKLKGKTSEQDKPDRWTSQLSIDLAAMSQEEFEASLKRDFGVTL